METDDKIFWVYMIGGVLSALPVLGAVLAVFATAGAVLHMPSIVVSISACIVGVLLVLVLSEVWKDVARYLIVEKGIWP